MILRRFVESLKQQHWTSVFIELVIVVLGVFFGLQAANWNDERRDRAAEAGYLTDLKRDVEFSAGHLELQIDKMSAQQLDRKALYEFATDPDRKLEPAERDRLVFDGLFTIFSLNINEVTFETLKSSGTLPLIRSQALVSELQALNAAIAKTRRMEADEGQVTYLFSDPILVDHIDMASVLRQPGKGPEKYLPWLGDAPDVAPTPAVMKTLRFANAVLYRAFLTDLRLRDLRGLLAKYRHIAVLIAQRQAELGAAP